MKGVRDWVFSQMVSKSVASSRPLSGSGSYFHEGPPDVESDSQSPTQTASMIASSMPRNTLYSSSSNRENQTHPPLQEVPPEQSSRDGVVERKMDPLAKIEDLQVKFLRLVQRLGQSEGNLLVAKVLYRIHLATLIRAGESDLKSVSIRSDRARAIAREKEATGVPDLNFPFRILVLGKTGVGKSATINSIFDQIKTETDAFQPATDCIQEVVGTVSGIRITFIDTPGFLPPCTSNMKRNRKIMLSVKKFIRRSPPDLVLYFERLDLVSMGYSDLHLLKLMTEVFGTAIWFNTILVMTHSSSTPPEGLNGYPVSYESYVTKCKIWCNSAYTRQYLIQTENVGLNVQSAESDLIYTVHSNTKWKNLKYNITDCGVSLTSFRDKYYVGTKLEDTVLAGKRLKFMMNVGQMVGHGQAAYGGSFEATLRGKDYPVRNDYVSLTTTALSLDKEMVLGGGFQSEFCPFRGTRLSVNANLNSRKMGQICVKVSSSEHLEIAFFAAISLLKALFRRKGIEDRSIEALEQ
ncbi:LOW QUALITY PROTEIN: translocase of chloroplast 90, chloroplastic [Carica papaya]|uniref:LOW QUALITY PROTEIN: translocase of chloroplast 90, chloroplastic n=1 Tax=Carica papaya TaxID=3649 RepID=UPI000B8CF64F|nr:LOW QUALITY PROTEIN: translocase of chloroplast 90, chloroplastic [Carica papaya]